MVTSPPQTLVLKFLFHRYSPKHSPVLHKKTSYLKLLQRHNRDNEEFIAYDWNPGAIFHSEEVFTGKSCTTGSMTVLHPRKPFSHRSFGHENCSPWDQSVKASLYQLYDIALGSTSSLPQNCYFRAKFTMHEIAQVMYSAFGTWCPEKIATLAGSSPWIGRYTLFTAGAQEKYPHMYMHIPTLTGQLSAILQPSTISTKYKILWLFVSLKG